MYTNWQIHVDMNCQQITKISRIKLNESENIPKSFRGGGLLFLNTRYTCMRLMENIPSMMQGLHSLILSCSEV